VRSRTSNTISGQQLQQWALAWVIEALQFKDQGFKCTAVVVWSIVLRAAARMSSIWSACCDLADAPSDTAVFAALKRGLPKTLTVLERRLNLALTDGLPRRVRKRSWTMAIDWHLVPYYGEPLASDRELYHCKPEKGTTTFHAYATACIISHGVRYTVGLTWVKQKESTVTVLARLLAQIQSQHWKIRRLLLDRAFFNVPVTEFLQQRKIPFLMPVMFRGRPPKASKRPPTTGLRWIQKQAAGWYPHLLKNASRQVRIRVCVAYRTYQDSKTGKRRSRKLLFGAWRVNGTPQEIRHLYRKRFGIEASYRQRRQARIYTCTRDPHLRLVFVMISLLLRNLWVFVHDTLLATDPPDADQPTQPRKLQLHLLRFERLLDWIANAVLLQLHDGSTPCIKL
jgi:hypothetical protein